MSQLIILSESDEQVVESKREAMSHHSAVSEIVVDSVEMCEIANDMLTGIRRAEKDIEAKRESVIKPMNEALRNMRALFDEPLAKLKAAKDALGNKVLKFRQDEELRRAAEMRRTEEERQRQLAEARAAEEKAAREALELRAAAQQADAETGAALAAAAEQAEIAASQASAAASIAEVSPVAVAMAAPAPRGGHAVRTNYTATITDKKAFVSHALTLAASGDESWLDMIEIDDKALAKIGKATNGTMKIPGVKFDTTQKLAARA